MKRIRTTSLQLPLVKIQVSSFALTINDIRDLVVAHGENNNNDEWVSENREGNGEQIKYKMKMSQEEVERVFEVRCVFNELCSALSALC